MTLETDDEIFARVKKAIAEHGQDAYENYQDFLADNRAFDPYWEDGWQAIVKNTVEDFVFGRDVMIETARNHQGSSMDLARGLAFALDQAASVHAKTPVSASPKAGP